MALQNEGNEFSLYDKNVQPSSTITKRRFVGWDDEQLADPNESAQGVAIADIAAGAVGVITTLGSVLVETGGTFAKGDPITCDANGRAVRGTPQNMKGIADAASTGAGQFVPVQLVGTNQIGGAQVYKVALSAAAGAGGVLSFQNPLGVDAIVTRFVLDVTTAATGAATVDAGVDDDGADSDDSLIDGLDVNAATGVFDNVDDQGTNGQSVVKLPAGEFVVVSQDTGDVTGLVGAAHISLITA